MYKHVLACALILCAPTALAAEEINLAGIDKSGNGIIDDGDEARVYFLHKENETYRLIDKNYNGILEPDEIKKFHQKAMGKTEWVRSEYALAVRSGQAKKAPKVDPPEEPKDGIERKVGVILRQSFDDVSSFIDPFDASEAQGATFSWSRDKVEDALKWSTQGVIAVPYTWRRQKAVVGEPYLRAFTLAPYLKVQRESASLRGSSTNNIQNLSFGLLSESAVANLGGATHYLRLSGGALTDFSGTAKSWLASASWMPVSNRYRIASPIVIAPLGATVRVSPSLKAEYASKIGDAEEPIFVEHNSSLRVGPGLSIKVKPIQHSFFVPEILQGLHFTANYSWLRDVQTQLRYDLAEYSLGYNLNKAGTFGVVATYQRGRVIETGEKIDLIKVGLSVKDPVPATQIKSPEGQKD